MNTAEYLQSLGYENSHENVWRLWRYDAVMPCVVVEDSIVTLFYDADAPIIIPHEEVKHFLDTDRLLAGYGYELHSRLLLGGKWHRCWCNLILEGMPVKVWQSDVPEREGWYIAEETGDNKTSHHRFATLDALKGALSMARMKAEDL